MAKSNKKVYLDYAAGVSANPSSIHEEGIKAKKELQNARAEVANILGARSSEIIFTNGGTESNNLAIQGTVLAWQGKNLPHIITTNIEHPSVLETFKMLKKRKLAEISIVPVEKNGTVNPKKIKKEIKKNTVLISVMYANNEIGTIQPIREIAREIRHYKKTHQKTFLNGLAGVGDPGNRGPEKKIFGGFLLPIFHTDAVQAVNYLDLNVEKLGIDLLSLSGSKIEGAGRVGVLYKRKAVPLVAILGGGDQEMGLRPGTENLPEILKFSKALKSAQKIRGKEVKRIVVLRDYFFKKIILQKNIIINGDLKDRLPNNLNISFPKIPSDLLVMELSAKGIMASSKSACKSSHKEGSYVIQAIRPESDIEIGGLRFSLGRQTTKADIDYTIRVLSKILQKLKKWYN
ncbi:MAG: cysteine desulfurase family protein [Candidatus Paceibacterota bacterium]|jgi:cysteine desulfurase